MRESDSQRWLTFFEQRGYGIFHRTANFIRLHFATDPAEALPVDLMLADEHTFRKISSESRHCDLGHGVQLAVPAPLHLIAMKLHALKSQARVERQKRSVQNSSPSSRNAETQGAVSIFDLPAFDSLPSAAGLTNLEAFQLSVRHALSLLPTLWSQNDGFVTLPKNEQRFSLR